MGNINSPGHLIRLILNILPIGENNNKDSHYRASWKKHFIILVWTYSRVCVCGGGVLTEFGIKPRACTLTFPHIESVSILSSGILCLYSNKWEPFTATCRYKGEQHSHRITKIYYTVFAWLLHDYTSFFWLNSSECESKCRLVSFSCMWPNWRLLAVNKSQTLVHLP